MVREVRGMLRDALTAVGGHQAEDAGLLNLLNPTATGVQEVIASGKRWCPAIYLETQNALKKCHPTKVDGF